MKVKPLYIYIIVFIVLIGGIIIIDSSTEPAQSQSQSMQQGEMPNDDVHKNLGNAPGSGNVSKEFREKMDNLKTRFESNPKDTVNAKEYARLLAAAHDPENSIEVYKSILSLDPNRNDLRLELATVYYNMQKFNEAKEQIEIVFESNPSSPDIQYNLGAVEAALGNKEKAKEIWQEIISNYPKSDAANTASLSLEKIQ